MSRVVKHLGSRSAPEDASVVLMAIPTFPGEKIVSMDMNGYFASGDDSSIDQPGEINWYGLAIPWGHVWATQMIKAGGTPGILGTVAAIDLLFNEYLFEVDTDGTEVWGGDADIDPEVVTGEEGHTVEELIDSGPIGVHKFFKREKLMSPFAAEGNNVIRFGDSFSADVRDIPAPAMGALNLFGVVRFAPDAETNFNVELDGSTAREAIGLLLTGDYTKIKAKIEGDTSTLGDYIRTVLFGGDQYVEADTLKGPAGKAHVKASIMIQSAISRSH